MLFTTQHLKLPLTNEVSINRFMTAHLKTCLGTQQPLSTSTRYLTLNWWALNFHNFLHFHNFSPISPCCYFKDFKRCSWHIIDVLPWYDKRAWVCESTLFDLCVWYESYTWGHCWFKLPWRNCNGEEEGEGTVCILVIFPYSPRSTSVTYATCALFFFH